MNTITQFCETINTLNLNSYILKNTFEPFSLMDELPNQLESLMHDPDFCFLLEQAKLATTALNDFIQPLQKSFVKAVKSFKPSKSSGTPYADFRVDDKPLVLSQDDLPRQQSFDEIIAELKQNGKTIKPVKRKSEIHFHGPCPCCNAPNEFLYDNNGKNTQFLCKACKHTFGLKHTPCNTAGFYCPHCRSKLQVQHERSQYDVFICPKISCSFYKRNKKDFDANMADHLRTSSHQYNLHYHYRHFHFDLASLDKQSDMIDTKVKLSKIHCDQHTLGLIMTYYINYGLSTRKTARILREIHGISVSHQTIANYAQTVAALMKPLVDNFEYELSDTLVGDETYVDVRRKHHYVFFFSDPHKKIITAYNIFEKRDTHAACQSIFDSLHKVPRMPKNLTIITDANPIYNAAQVFFDLHDLHFDLIQVVGVSNKDATSKQYRPFKQIEERLNRTFKQNYYGTNGFHSLARANAYMVAYVAFFNFLRPHSSLNFNTPVQLDSFSDSDLMPDKWLKLLQLSTRYALA